jgi:hypothetical protein
VSARRAARAFLGALLALALLAPAAAQASFGFVPGPTGFAAGASNRDASPATRAGTHPYSFELAVGLETEGGARRLRDLTVHLPPGLLINPTTINECSEAAFHTPRVSPYEATSSGESCPNSSQVGVVGVDVGGTVRHYGLFSLVPPFGSTAALGASPGGMPLVFAVRAREADTGLDLVLDEVPQSLDLRSVKLTIWGSMPWEGTMGGHNLLRGNCLNEQTGGSNGECLVFGSSSAPLSLIKSYLTLPTTPCGIPPSFRAEASSWQGDGAQASATIPALEKCNKALTTPRVQLMTDVAAARTGLAFNLEVNDGGGILNPGGIARPAIKQAVLSLPEGLTINPSLGAGLGACDEAEFARESAGSEPGAGCPNNSKIGDVTVEGALGLAEPLRGSLYLARPHANPFGSLVAVYLLARSPRRGLIVKSIGKIEPDERTGRLTATFDQLPRLLYAHFSLTLREGQRSALLSPPACGTYTADFDVASWAEPSVFAHGSSFFLIDRGDGGGPCPAGGILPFSPGLLAGSLSPSPATYTPFYLRMTRTDPEQEITSYSASFPPGLLAKIAGVAKCSDAAIAAAAARTGAEEEANPSCPASSRIGRTVAGYGVGETLAWASGGLYLAGAWRGAPLSIVAIDSAKIGPFDLGVVVVRTAVRVDTRTAQASIDAAGSDPIPHILHGIPLHVRDIRVYVDRPGFTLTPTSCDPMAVTSTLRGAGTDPFRSGDETSAGSSQRYQLLGCRALGFKPRLSLRLRGGTRRSAYPSLRAVVRPRPGQANISFASVKLPPSLFLAQEHLREICTRAQFAAGGGGGAGCPRGSVYGRARAWTPLFEEPFEGPVYIRSSNHAVPDLVATLRAHGLTIVLEGRIDSVKGGLRGSFAALPDAPLTKFVMTLPGGKHGLLAVAEDLCRSPRRANSRWIAQSNATAVLRPRLQVQCKRSTHKRKGAHRRGRRR